MKHDQSVQKHSKYLFNLGAGTIWGTSCAITGCWFCTVLCRNQLHINNLKGGLKGISFIMTWTTSKRITVDIRNAPAESVIIIFSLSDLWKIRC